MFLFPEPEVYALYQARVDLSFLRGARAREGFAEPPQFTERAVNLRVHILSSCGPRPLNRAQLLGHMVALLTEPGEFGVDERDHLVRNGEEALDAADKGMKRLQTAYRLLLDQIEDSDVEPGDLPEAIAEHKQRFLEAMDEDFNTAGALAALFDIAHEANSLLSGPEPPKRPVLAAIKQVYDQLGEEALGLRLEQESDKDEESLESGLAQLLIDLRASLRKEKQFELADGIRGGLTELGIQLEDKPDGTVWRKT